jgi:predicted phage terminase large subunit-like protein
MRRQPEPERWAREHCPTLASASKILAPQPGPQTLFLASSADIVIYGGAMGGGKTYALLLECLRHVFSVPGFHAVIFRRTLADVKKPGSLRDASKKVFGVFPEASYNQAEFKWTFEPHGNTVTLAQIQHDDTKEDYRGAEIPLICFDELISFLESQFVFLLSRNRTDCGIRSYVRATTNPSRSSWVYRYVGPWVNPRHELYGNVKPGDLLYFRRFEEDIPIQVAPFVITRDRNIVWVTSECPLAKSLSFIPSTVFDNPLLLERDEGYLANLEAQSQVDRARNLHGDWNAVLDTGGLLKEDDIKIWPADLPLPQVKRWYRFWDLAGTEVDGEIPKNFKGRDPDYTAGAKWGVWGRDAQGRKKYIVADLRHFRGDWDRVERELLIAANEDGKNCLWRIEQEPGSAGKNLMRVIQKILRGRVRVKALVSTGDKITRAQPVSAAAKQGRIWLAEAPWNPVWLDEHILFPSDEDEVHDDIVDTSSAALMQFEPSEEVAKMRVG